jgi:hypothetical protein
LSAGEVNVCTERKSFLIKGQLKERERERENAQSEKK